MTGLVNNFVVSHKDGPEINLKLFSWWNFKKYICFHNLENLFRSITYCFLIVIRRKNMLAEVMLIFLRINWTGPYKVNTSECDI